MGFQWATKNNACHDVTLDNSFYEEPVDKVIVLGRIRYRNAVEGCCGAIRFDSIYPVGSIVDRHLFEAEAIETMREFRDELNTFSIEYFYGKPGQNWREDGQSIFLFEFDEGVWTFFEKDEPIFSVRTEEELREQWER